jgi:hypothetical protein
MRSVLIDLMIGQSQPHDEFLMPKNSLEGKHSSEAYITID